MTGADCPCLTLFDDAVNNLVHFLFASCVVCFVQNGLLLLLRHGSIGSHGWLIHGQSHAKSDGYFVKIHTVLLGCCIQHIFNKNPIPGIRRIHKDVCVLMIPTKPLNFRKPRIQVNYDFAIGSLIVVNLFKNDL